MMVYPKHLTGVLKGKHALELDPYLDGIASNINGEKMNLRNNIMREYRSDNSGKLYFTTPAVADEGIGEGAPALSLGYAVRWDLYKEIGSPDIKSGDDYIDALLKMKKLYPETEDGLPVYATSAYNDLGTHAWTMRGLLDKGYATLDGNSLYMVDVKENNIKHNVYQESEETAFWADMKFYNRMYKEGLLDPDCFITKGEDMVDKYAKGQYIGGITNWHYGKWNEAAKQEDPNTLKTFIMLPSHMGWTNAIYRAGWADKIFFVSSHSAAPERAVSLLDYFNSKEFARLCHSGIEGINWEKDENGVPSLTEDTIDMKVNPSRIQEWKETGLGALGNFSEHAQNSVLEDGAPASLWEKPEVWIAALTAAEKDFSKTMGVDYPSQLLTKKKEAGECIDQRNFNTAASACMPSAPKNITRIDNNCTEIIINSLPGIVQAQDEASFQSAREKLLSDLKDANIETAVSWWTENWNTAKSMVDKLDK